MKCYIERNTEKIRRVTEKCNSAFTEGGLIVETSTETELSIYMSLEI